MEKLVLKILTGKNSHKELNLLFRALSATESEK